MSQSVLIIDDEPTLAKNIETYLVRHGFEVRVAHSGEAALAALDGFRPDFVLLDLGLPGMDGLEALERIRSLDSHIKTIVVTGRGSVETAVDAMKGGAYDYVSKPLVLAELKLLLDKAAGQERLEGALAYYKGKEAERSGLAKIVGESPPMVAVKRRIRQFVEAENQLVDGEPPVVLITGDTGTGKELAARAFHFDGSRSGEPFVELNCAAIPEHLLEAELFGFERGAFTDAHARKPGLMEAAHGGTLFLDEIGDMPLAAQAKILKLMEDKTVRRLGGLRDRKVSVRIIAATNQDLELKVQSGAFRADLFFRLRVVHIDLPPLRVRGDDIRLLASQFLDIHAKRYRKRRMRLSPDAASALVGHGWPGNVRELNNIIEQAVLIAEGTTVERRDVMVADAEHDATESGALATLPQNGTSLVEVERNLVAEALVRTEGNVTRAARLLGISRDTLRYRIEKHQLRAAV